MNTKPSSLPSVLMGMINGKKNTRYEQFMQIEHKEFLSVQCPKCNGIFGLTARHVEKIGEASYLTPYSCPYCHIQLTLKNS